MKNVLWFWVKRLFVHFGERELFCWLILGIQSVMKVAAVDEVPKGSDVWQEQPSFYLIDDLVGFIVSYA